MTENMAGTSELSYVKHVVSEYYDYFAIPVEKNGAKQYEPFQDRIAVEEAHFSYKGSEREALCGLKSEAKRS